MSADLRQRDPRLRESPYLGWIAALPCIACFVEGAVNWEVQVAHVRFADADAGWRSVGMGEKPSDRRVTPLCGAHHQGDMRKRIRGQHGQGEREFWEALGIDVVALCNDLSAAYDGQAPGFVVIATHVATAWRKRKEIE